MATEQTLYHGTDVDLEPGDLIDSDFTGYAYATTDVSVAEDFAADHANLVQFDGTISNGYVYEVAPDDGAEVEPDPEYDLGVAVKTTGAFRVIRKLKTLH